MQGHKIPSRNKTSADDGNEVVKALVLWMLLENKRDANIGEFTPPIRGTNECYCDSTSNILEAYRYPILTCLSPGNDCIRLTIVGENATKEMCQFGCLPSRFTNIRFVSVFYIDTNTSKYSNTLRYYCKLINMKFPG